MSFNIYFQTLLLLLVICKGAHLNEVTTTPCEGGWMFIEQHCYKAVKETITWQRASAQCSRLGGHLASIHSEEQQNILTTYMLMEIKTNFWIGLHVSADDDNHVWEDGSNVNYTCWGPGQPSRTYNQKKEECVEMRYNPRIGVSGDWNDEACSSIRNYICKKQIIPTYFSTTARRSENVTDTTAAIPTYFITTEQRNENITDTTAAITTYFSTTVRRSENVTDTTAVPPGSTTHDIQMNCTVHLHGTDTPENTETCGDWISFDQYCYKAVREHVTWSEASSRCVGKGGHLASIHSEGEQDFLHSIMLSEIKAPTWIGLHDTASEGNFVWDDGSNVNFRSWGEGQPHGVDRDGRKEDCVEMFYRAYIAADGDWNDAVCNNENPYICKKAIPGRRVITTTTKMPSKPRGGASKSTATGGAHVSIMLLVLSIGFLIY